MKIANAAVAAIAFACLSPVAPALAEGPTQIEVSTRGLRLDSTAGLAELSRRVSVAARAACDDGDRTLQGQIAAQTCRKDLERVGTERVAELAAKHSTMVASMK